MENIKKISQIFWNNKIRDKDPINELNNKIETFNLSIEFHEVLFLDKIANNNILSKFSILSSIYSILLNKYFDNFEGIITSYNSLINNKDNAPFFLENSSNLVKRTFKEHLQAISKELQNNLTYVEYDVTSLNLDLYSNFAISLNNELSEENCKGVLLQINETSQVLVLAISYVEGFVEKSLIQHFGLNFKKFLVHLEEFINNDINEFDFLTREERHQLLVEFNDTKVDYPRDKTIVQLFEEQVDRASDNLAVIFEDTQLTYRELNEEANQLGDYLRQNYNIQPDDLIGVKLEKSEKMILVIFGILKSGAAYVPIDTSYPIERIDYIEKDTRAKVIIDDAFFENFKNQKEKTKYTKENLTIISKSDSLVYVIYTSGTTGQPKGVMIENKGLVNRLIWMQKAFPLNNLDTLIQKTTYSFDVSVWELLWWSIYGAKLSIPKSGSEKDPAQLIEIIHKNNVTVIHFVPSMLSVFLEFIKENTNQKAFLKTLKQVFVSGEALTLYQKKLFYNELPHISLINLYGPTEASIDVSHYNCAEQHNISSVPIGKPIDNTSLYILDEKLDLIPIGVVGKLYISGAGLSRGYINMQELTTERFIDNPFEKGAKMYDTGDLARWLADGNIEFLGRKDSQVKIRGFRIELGEIENAISHYSDSIQQVVVEVKDFNQEKALVAYYVSKHYGVVKSSEIQNYLRGKIPEYMLPNFYVDVESIPLTLNGKINRKALPNVTGQDLIKIEYVAPRNKTEKKIAEIWQEILHIKEIGIHDSFFNLGGHSLKTTQLVSRYAKEFSVTISVKSLFVNTTIAEHSKLIIESEKEEFKIIHQASESSNYPASYAQQRLWILCQFKDASRAYHMPLSLSLKGDIKPHLFIRAIELIVDRHESLRTTFIQKKTGEIRQKIATRQELDFVIDKLNLQNLTTNEQKKRSVTYITEGTEKAFDLKKGPLLRIGLICLSANDYILFYNMHHIISDGWSLEVLTNDVLEAYNLLLGDENAFLPALSIQYKDYSKWQSTVLTESKINNDRNYWISQLDDELPVLDLPTQKGRPLKKTYNGNIIKFTFSEIFSKELNEFSNQHGGSLFMLLLTGLNTLLYRYTQQTDIIIGGPIAARNHVDLEKQIGFFVNTLALRTKFDKKFNFIELFEQVKQTAINAYEHQSYPFDKLVNDLNIQRDTSRNPLFDVMLVLQNIEKAQQTFGSPLSPIVINPLEQKHSTSHFDITLTFHESQNKINGELEFNTDIYSFEFMQQLVSHLESILKQGIVNKYTPLLNLDYLSTAEIHKQIYLLNETNVSFSKNKTIVHLFEEQVCKTPTDTALVFENNRITYAELNRQSNKLAHYLRQSYSIKADDLIAVKLERSSVLIISILAILKAGAAYVPIDPTYPIERINFMLEDSACKVCINEEELDKFFNSKLDLKDRNLPSINHSSSLAYIIYTSGSTGIPKGVMMEHGCVYNLIQDHSSYSINHQKVSQFTSISFDVSFQEIFFPLTRGGELHVLNEVTRLDATLLTDYVKENQITALFLPTSYLKFLAKEINQKLNNAIYLKDIVVAGEQLVLSDDIVSFLKNNDIQLHNHYGPAETHVVTTYVQSNALNNLHLKVSPIGKPIANTRIYILNENLKVQAENVFGNLYISGEAVSRGYLRRVDLSSERFVPDLLNANKRMYKTGDIARWMPDGNLEFLGRKDDQIKIRGYRIELGELEYLLLSIDGVRQAAVLVYIAPDGEKELAAYLALNDYATKKQIRNILKGMVPGYMIPQHFIVLDNLPLNGNGKIDRKLLLQNIDCAQEAEDYILPVTPLEWKLKEIWEEVLNLKNINIDSNFFDIGGHSLKGVLTINRIYEKLNVKIDLQDVFDYATIESMAKFIESKTTEQYEPITIAPSNDWYFLSHSQERMWILNQIAGFESSYNFTSVFILQGKLNINALKNAFNQVIEKYEILRTVFDFIDNHPVQLIKSTDEIGFEVNEYSLDEFGNINKQLEELYNKNALDPFNLQKGPMIRVTLAKLSKDKYYLLITAHYIIYDGWSLKLFMRQLVENYNLFESGVSLQREPLRLQYKDYSEWQRNKLKVKENNTSRTFWLEQFRDKVPLLNLPIDKPRPKCINYDGDYYEVLIDQTITNELNKLCYESKATMFGVLFAVANVLLSKYTGQTDIVIGTTVSGREHIDTENQIGSFVNSLALRNTFKSTDSFKLVLEEISKNISKAFKYAEYPFDLLVEELKLERDLRRTPLFDVMLLLHNSDSEADKLLKMNGVEVSIPEKKLLVSKFDLSFIFYEQLDALKFQIEYKTSLFNRSTIELISVHFLELIKCIVNNPETKVSDLSVVSKIGPQPEIYILKTVFSEKQLEEALNKTALLIKQLNFFPNCDSELLFKNIVNSDDQKALIKEHIAAKLVFTPLDKICLQIYVIADDRMILIPQLPLQTRTFIPEDLFVQMFTQQLLQSDNNVNKLNKDFMIWQSDLFSREIFKKHKLYWKELYKNLSFAKDLKNIDTINLKRYKEFNFQLDELKVQLSPAKLLSICELFYFHEISQYPVIVFTRASRYNDGWQFPGNLVIEHTMDKNDFLVDFQTTIEKKMYEASMFQLYPHERVKNETFDEFDELIEKADMEFSFSITQGQEIEILEIGPNCNVLIQFTRNVKTKQLHVYGKYNENILQIESEKSFKEFINAFHLRSKLKGSTVGEVFNVLTKEKEF